MDLSEICQLIEIRNYMNIAIGNYGIKKEVVSELNDMVMLMDQLITEKITSSEFKDLVGFKNLKEIKDEVIRRSNIKSGLPRIR